MKVMTNAMAYTNETTYRLLQLGPTFHNDDSKHRSELSNVQNIA